MHILATATTTFALLIAIASSTASATPAPAPELETSPRQDFGNWKACPTLGAYVCGWDLMNRGADIDNLRTMLCRDLGKCDRNSGDVWNTLWQCTSEDRILARYVCGGQNSCVIDKYTWLFICRGGSC